jgi:phage-related baseplate assembly protein
MQIDYTSRDYEGLKADLINLINTRTGFQWEANDPSDLGSVMVESFAYMGDIMSYYLDRVANETSIDTAIKTETLLRFAELYGYKPSGPTPAQISITFTNNSDANVDLPIGTQVMAPLTYGDYTEIYFETTQAVTQLQPTQSISVTAREGKTANTDRPDLISPTTYKPLPVSLGSSDGTANQEFQIFDVGIVDNSLVVYVGQGVAFSPWKYVDSLVNSGPNDLVFTTRLNADGTTSIIFGDGVNGYVPPVNQLVSALYKTSVGIAGNIVSNAVQEITFIPGNGNPEVPSLVTATNEADSFGGANGDSSTQLRKKIKAAIVARKRAVTLADYEYLTLQVSQVGKAKAVGSVYSNITVYVQSQDDGSTTPGIAAGSPTSAWTVLSGEVSTYLADKIPVGTTVTVQYPTYTPLYLSMNLNVESAYRQAAVKLAISKALLNTGGLFSYENNSFGRSIPVSSVISTIAQVEGVASVELTKFNTTNASSVGTISLSPNQVGYLLPANLVFTVTGGIA